MAELPLPNLRQINISQKIKSNPNSLKPELEEQMFHSVLESLSRDENSSSEHELSRTNLRAKLLDLLSQANKQKQKIRPILSELSIFRDMNEGYFSNKSALHFCQLAKNVGFIEKSNI
jgi:hypothetical protein